MSRCTHGFEVDVIACPAGCGGPTTKVRATRRYVEGEGFGRARKYTDAEIEAALLAEPSVSGAASRLGMARGAFIKRTERVPRLRELAAARAASPKWGTQHSHPSLVDMTGQVRAGARILSRAQNVNGNARWLCELACGHEAILEGITIRDAERHGRTMRCADCRSARPGTVRRRHG